MKNNTVIIIGRPNTGKSTLFNKILEKREVITNDLVGTTRDIISKDTHWRGINFNITDTGGIDYKIKSKLDRDIQNITQKTIKNADVIIFLVNAKEGAKLDDYEIAKKLRKNKNKSILVVNKADNKILQSKSFEFYKLGLGMPIPISAATGSGIGDLLDKITSFLKNNTSCINNKNDSNKYIKVSIVGKPNVGKSSFFNAISKETKVLVSKMSGTTIDTIDTLISYKEKMILITDTAGLRRKSKIKSEIEKISSKKSIYKIKNSNICLLLLDATKKISRHDIRIATKIIDNNKSIILVINKWDKIKSSKTSKKRKIIAEYIKYVQLHFPFLYWAPIIFISAKYKDNIGMVLKSILEIDKERKKIIDEKELKMFADCISREFYQKNWKTFKNYFFVQSNTFSPKFYFYTKNKNNIPISFLKYLEKKLRNKYSFLGTPINITVCKK